MKMADGHPLHNLTMPFIAAQCFLFIVSFPVVGEREYLNLFRVSQQLPYLSYGLAFEFC